MIYGVVRKHDKEALPEELRKQLNSMYDNTPKPDKWWPWHKKLEEPYDNWSKFDAWNAVMNGTMKKVMKEKLEYLLVMTKGMDL
jgi:hypothetical protein